MDRFCHFVTILRRTSVYFQEKRSGGLSVSADIFHLAGKIGNRGEDAASDDVALDFREPDFDLIQSQGVCWGEVKPYLRVPAEEFFDGFGFVSGQVVQHSPHRSTM